MNRLWINDMILMDEINQQVYVYLEQNLSHLSGIINVKCIGQNEKHLTDEEKRKKKEKKIEKKKTTEKTNDVMFASWRIEKRQRNQLR